MNRHRSPDVQTCQRLLPVVSRTFALTIRVLPGALRDPVTVAYLLCRLADILEDSTTENPRARIECLDRMALHLADPPEAEALGHSLDAAERLGIEDPASVELLRQRAPVFRAFCALPPPQREIVSRWVQAMCAGMATYVARETRAAFAASPAASGPIPYVLDTVEEMRAYAWYVAGTVGHLLTDLFILHLGADAVPGERLRELAAPFGLGLQFTNILQDLAEDRQRGWSYIPEELARRHGTTARFLDDPRQRPAALRVVGDLVGETAAYLDQAMEYTLLLPRSAPRLRLFCLWPTFFAVRTLVRVWGEDRVVSGGEKIRITRSEVRRVIRSTAAACLFDRGLERLYRKERARLTRRIALCPI